MHRKVFIREIVALTIFLLIGIVEPANAYIDPGSGSLIVQVVIAVFFGAAFYLRQIKLFILNLFKRKRNDQD